MNAPATVGQEWHRPSRPRRRVAIVHYWLVTMRGGERVVERLLKLFPEADLFTHVYDPSKVSRTIRNARVTTSFIDRLPLSRRMYQSYLPLMPMALEGFDLRGYDLVISSESGPAKAVITDPSSLHLCYCHSPMRYLWDQYHSYHSMAGPLTRLMMPWLCHRLRQWDVTSSARVDRFAANSSFVRDRIRKVWRRDSEIIHPPVETGLFAPSSELDDTYLWVGQLVPYKRPDLAVEAFSQLGLPLLVVGDGPMRKRLRAAAAPNIRFVDRLDFDGLRRAYARARALVFTAEEDFGMVPVEAMASGRPVLAYGRGGVRDSVIPGSTGILFDRQEVDSLLDGVERLEQWLPDFDPREAIAQASLFAPERFDEKILALAEH